MIEIQYHAPRTLDDAVGLLREHGRRARVLAGGTDLIVQLRENTLARRLGGDGREPPPDTIIDGKRIRELNELSLDPRGGLVVGAAVACSRIYEHEEIARRYPALIDAAALIGSIQIQNRASLGGNLCNASPAADGIPPLIVHRATCRIAGPRGERRLPVEEFCTAPGRTALAPDELLVAIEIRPPPPRSAARYERFIPRNEMDIAVAGAASWIELEPDLETIRDARIALAAVAPTPLLAGDAARALLGKKAGREAFAAAAEAARSAAQPISDLRGEAWQRTHLAGVLVERTLEAALDRARRS